MYARQADFRYKSDAMSQADIKEVFCVMAADFGADRARFAEDIASEDVLLSVKESQRHGVLHGVWSTPTYVVNGTVVTTLDSSTTPEQWAAFIGPLLS